MCTSSTKPARAQVRWSLFLWRGNNENDVGQFHYSFENGFLTFCTSLSVCYALSRLLLFRPRLFRLQLSPLPSHRARARPFLTSMPCCISPQTYTRMSYFGFDSIIVRFRYRLEQSHDFAKNNNNSTHTRAPDNSSR